MKIKSVEIKNFKSLKEVKIENIGDFNVFIGKNNSGKTAIFDALRFFKLLINTNFNFGNITKEYGVDDLIKLAFDEKEPIPITIRFNDDGKEITYSIKIEKDYNFYDSLWIGDAKYSYGSMDPPLNGQGLIKIQGSQKELLEGVNPKVQNLVISVHIDKNRVEYQDFYNTVGSLNNFFKDMWFLSCFRRVDQSKQSSSSPEVEYNASNSMQVLIGPNINPSEVREDLEYIFKDFVDVIIPSSPEVGQPVIKAKIKDMELAKEISEQHIGSGIFNTALPIILGCYTNNQSLFIEEPEQHLNPDAQRRILEVLKKTSEEKQVFITTHSPVFVESLELFNVDRNINIYNIRKQSNIHNNKEKESKINRFTNNEYLGQDGISKEHRYLLHVLTYDNNTKIFFNDKIVLVEGLSDKIIFNHLLISPIHFNEDIGIISTGGKDAFGSYKELLDLFGIDCSIIADRNILSTKDKVIDLCSESLKDKIKNLDWTTDEGEIIKLLYSDKIFVLKEGSIEDYYSKSGSNKIEIALKVINKEDGYDFDPGKKMELDSIISCI